MNLTNPSPSAPTTINVLPILFLHEINSYGMGATFKIQMLLSERDREYRLNHLLVLNSGNPGRALERRSGLLSPHRPWRAEGGHGGG